MRTRRTRGGQARKWLVIGLAAWAWLAGASVAHALTVSVPADVPRSAIVTVAVDVAEPAGTVTLKVDDVAVATAAGTPGGDVVFPAVPLSAGVHSVAAVLDAGGTPYSAAPVRVTSWNVPSAPQILRPTGGLVAGAADIVMRAGASTSLLTVVVNGVTIGTKAGSPGSDVYFGVVGTPPGWSVFTVIASNPLGERTRIDGGFVRIDYPASTSIVVDKSDYRLYWIQNDILIKTYPIAIGKRRTPTPNAMWIVGRKEYMPPRGVYGPRRLKLSRFVSYRRRGRRYVRYKLTGYGIHGTNQPWVIGTMASHGCIRLTNDQILDLWPQVPLGTVVQTRQ